MINIGSLWDSLVSLGKSNFENMNSFFETTFLDLLCDCLYIFGGVVFPGFIIIFLFLFFVIGFYLFLKDKFER